jgi:hypothetical protein
VDKQGERVKSKQREFLDRIGRMTRPLLELWWQAHPDKTNHYPAGWILEEWAARRIHELEAQLPGSVGAIDRADALPLFVMQEGT